MKSMFDIIAQLPNEDIQIDRSSTRRTFPCPSCGENVEGCRAVRTSPEKPFRQLGTSIECPRCGRFTVEKLDDGKGDYEVVTETGERYDRFSRVRAAAKRFDTFMDNPTSVFIEGQPMLAALAAEFAEELGLADESVSELVFPIKIALGAYCDLVKDGQMEYVEPLARFAHRCHNITDEGLSNQLRDAYALIESCRGYVSSAAYLEAMMERASLDCWARARKGDRNAVEDYIEIVESCSEEFGALTAENRALCPYAAADGWFGAVCIAREDGDDDDICYMAEKGIEFIRLAHEDGAPMNPRHAMTLVALYRSAPYEPREKYERLLSESKLWSDPFLLASADYLLAESIAEKAAGDGRINPENIPAEERAEGVALINEAIQILETYSDIAAFAPMLPHSYWFRSVLTGDKDDRKTACCYTIYLRALGMMEDDDADLLLRLIFGTEEKDSQLRKWYKDLVKKEAR